MQLNEYKLMWLYVYFDLPTQTKAQRKAYTTFRKALIKDGFTMQQYSIYTRHCPSIDHVQTHIRRITPWLPDKGKVSFLTVTEKQFRKIKNYWGKSPVKSKNAQSEQLLLFT